MDPEELPTLAEGQSTVTEVSSDNHSAVCPIGEIGGKGNVEDDQNQSVSSVSGDNTERISLSKDHPVQNSDNTPESSSMNGMHSMDSEQNGNEGNEEEEEDMDSTSEISDFSDFSQESWNPVHGPIAWVQEQMRQGQSARSILEDLVPPGTEIPDEMDPIMLWRLIINIVSEPPKRKKLENINTLEDVITLMKSCNKIIVLTGAGVSVSCGIPDFRSRDGVYARLAVDFPNLPNPQAMFDIHFFRNDPRPFFKFAKEIYPGQFKPSLCHHFIRLIESQGKLLRNYTQNIDTLEQEAGIERVVQCHGSFATATCTNCKLKVKSDVVREDIFKQVIPKCPQCPEGTENAIMKPDIVFFGESLPEDFHKQMAQDKDECDLLIVIGSSLKVKPVALIPNSVPAHVPQILINRERLHYLNFDVELLGDCDNIIGELCHRLGTGWDQMAPPDVSPLTEVVISSLPTPPISPQSERPAASSSPSSMSVEQGDKMAVDAKDNKESSTELSGMPECSSSAAATSNTQSALEEVKKKEEGHNGDDKIFCGESEKEPVSCADCSSSDNKEGLQAAATDIHYDRGDCVDNVANPTSSSSLVESVSSSNLPPASQASVLKPDKEEKSLAGNNVINEVSTTTSASNNKRVSPQQEEKQDHNKDSTESDVSSTSNEHSKTHHHKHHHNHSSHHHHPHNHKHSHHHHHHHHHHHRHHNHENHHRHGHHHHQHSSSGSKSLNADHHKHENSLDSTEPCEKRPRLENESEILSDTGINTEDSDLASGAKSEKTDGQNEVIDDELEEMRKMWQGRKNRVSLAQRLADNQYLFLPPNRYVFKGAEVFSDSEEEVDSDDDEAHENNEENSNDMSAEAGEEQELQVVEMEETSAGDGSTASSSSSLKPSVPAVAEDVDEKNRVGDVSSSQQR